MPSPPARCPPRWRGWRSRFLSPAGAGTSPERPCPPMPRRGRRADRRPPRCSTRWWPWRPPWSSEGVGWRWCGHGGDEDRTAAWARHLPAGHDGRHGGQRGADAPRTVAVHRRDLPSPRRPGRRAGRFGVGREVRRLQRLQHQRRGGAAGQRRGVRAAGLRLARPGGGPGGRGTGRLQHLPAEQRLLLGALHLARWRSLADGRRRHLEPGVRQRGCRGSSLRPRDRPRPGPALPGGRLRRLRLFGAGFRRRGLRLPGGRRSGRHPGADRRRGLRCSPRAGGAAARAPATADVSTRSLAVWSASGLVIALSTSNPVYRVVVLLCALNLLLARGRRGSGARILLTGIGIAGLIATLLTLLLSHTGRHVLVRLPAGIPAIARSGTQEAA